MLKLVLPALGTAALGPLLGATDAAVIGRFGSLADLAALSPATCAIDIVGLLLSFLPAATVTKLAGARGRADFAAARSMLSDSCCLAVCVGAALTLIMSAGCRLWLSALTSPATFGVISGPATAYVRVRALAWPAQMLQMVFSAACVSALQDTKTPLYAAAVGGIANLALDLAFVRYLGLGCAGVAAATVMGQLIALILVARALRRSFGFDAGAKEDGLPLLQGPSMWLASLRPSRMMPLLAFAGPFLLFKTLQMVLFSLETRMGTEFGALSLAAHQVTYSMWKLLILLGLPLLDAGQALVSEPFASGTAAGLERARGLARATLVLAAAMGVTSGVVSFAACTYLPPLFSSDAQVIQLAKSFAVPMAMSNTVFPVWFANEGLMYATGRASMMSLMYCWNLTFYFTGSRVVLGRGLSIFYSWVNFASMHVIFVALVSIVLRLPGGLLHSGGSFRREQLLHSRSSEEK